VKNPTFAIKTLLENDPETFEAEVEAHRRLMKETNEHLIRLLVTIQHGTHRSLIFPWAEGGNLLQFWEKRSDVASCRPDVRWVRWMAKQFWGMAEVLKQVHTPTKLDGQEGNPMLSAPHQDSLRDRTEKIGIHGDLKPENILWFIDSDSSIDGATDFDDEDSGPKGELRVADFGLATFHSKRSHRRPAKGMAVSKTHRAPEYEEETVTQYADLWSFGCILLEFLVWYQDGMENGINRFSDQRADEEANDRYEEDKFFIEDTLAHPEQQSRVVFKVKDAVTEVSERICNTLSRLYTDERKPGDYQTSGGFETQPILQRRPRFDPQRITPGECRRPHEMRRNVRQITNHS
jgi:serine/threonine protein kinase